MTHRVYLVGTDTGAGKTTLACALLQLARRQTERVVVPFKPAQSGDDDPSDAERLLDAAGLPRQHLPQICPLRYEQPLAPGVADDPMRFLRPGAANAAPAPEVLRKVQRSLEAYERQTAADVVLIEGAGGLHVPMPGGTWQPQWITELATHVAVVGRAGLGTINHTLLTLDACASLGIPVVGFYLVHTTPDPDPSTDDNAPIIATARSHPHLGTLGFDETTPPPALLHNLLDPLQP